MRALSTRQDRPPRYTARLMIKLNAEAQAALTALCTAGNRAPSRVLRHVIGWGLEQRRGLRMDRSSIPDPTRTVVVRLTPEGRSRVHAAARAAGADASAWVCALLRRVTLADLLAYWQTGEAEPRSHDSRQ